MFEQITEQGLDFRGERRDSREGFDHVDREVTAGRPVSLHHV